MAQDTSKKNMIIAQGLSLFSNAEESVFTEESIWRSIVYQCIISKVSLGKIWPLLHFKEYDGIKKGRPILDDETYKEILEWTSCSNRDLLMPDEQCEQRMTELLIMLLETESWYYEKKESDATCKVISINLKGDKLRLCYGAYAENDEGFLVDYLPVQTPAEPKISYTLFEELFYIKNEKMKQLFFRQLGIDTREIIYNPLRKFSVGCNKELSFLDLYIMDYELFTKIKNGDFDIVFAPELMNFFEKNKPYQKNVPFNIKQKKMIDAWERFNNSRRNRTIRELNEKLIKDNIEQSLLRATLSKEIRWLEVLDVHSQTTINRQYVCDFYNLKWDFTVSGYKKENKWRANFELKWKNRYDDMSSFGGACHAELYKAIRDSVIRKEKPIVNQYIKKREPGERKREIEIGSSDFLVRTNLFRCYHKEHLVEEILGVVKVVSEAVTAFIAHITAQFPNAKFYAEVVSENRASIKILKKLNFVEKSIEKNGFALNGFNHDLIRFEK